jgi:hypothetical protein
MARGLSRDQAQAKNAKKNAGVNKGNQEALTAGQRAERDAKLMQEKAARKEKERAEKSQTEAGAAQVAEEQARKEKQRADKKERAFQNTQVGKASRK